MPVDISIYLSDRPGQLAAVARHLADADVNIDGYFGLVVGERGIMHLLLDDAVADRSAQQLRDAGFEVGQPEEVLVLPCEDRPGTLAERLEPIAEAGVNITLSYLAAATRIVVGTDDPDRARQALADAQLS